MHVLSILSTSVLRAFKSSSLISHFVNLFSYDSTKCLKCHAQTTITYQSVDISATWSMTNTLQKQDWQTALFLWWLQIFQSEWAQDNITPENFRHCHRKNLTILWSPYVWNDYIWAEVDWLLSWGWCAFLRVYFLQRWSNWLRLSG